MEIRERYIVDIRDMSADGEGIGSADGMAVFAPKTVKGDMALIEITQVKKSFAKGRLVKLESPSAHRIDPVCPHGEQCGGCPLNSMDYQGQLVMKRKWVHDRLVRIGGLEKPPVAPVIGMDLDPAAGFPVEYRNKAQFPIQAGRLLKNKEGKYRNTKPCSVGFYRAKSHDVVDCRSCLIQAEPALAAAEAVKRYVGENQVSVYDEKNRMGLLRHLVVRSAFATGEVMVVLVVNGERLPKVERLIQLLDDGMNALTKAGEEPFWSLESVILNVNKGRGSEVLGREFITLAGKSSITDYLGDMAFEISPLSFYQINPVQMKKLYDKVAEFAQLTGEETILDLYCGVGSIGLYCAGKARRVIGIESVKQAVLDANRNAVINGIVNAEFICGRAEEILPQRLQNIKADVVILDPPRSGCHPALLEAVLDVAPKRIVYVSCDPATMARDIKFLVNGGDAENRPDERAGKGAGAGAVTCADSGTKTGSGMGNGAGGQTDEACASAGTGSGMCIGTGTKTEAETENTMGAERKTAGKDSRAQGSYDVEKVQPVDMFPGSGHVETCVLLSHKNS